MRRIMLGLLVVPLMIIIGIAWLILSGRFVTSQDCQPLWEDIQATLVTVNCQNFGNEHACYGNKLLSAKYASGRPTQNFSVPGDVSALNALSSIEAQPWRLNGEEWGVGVLHIETLLAGTHTGDVVTMILYGETSVEQAENVSVSTRRDAPVLTRFPAFYFSTLVGLTGKCIDLPTGMPNGGLIVETPHGTSVTFKANGVDITLSSTVLLQAVPDVSMNVIVLEGQAVVEVPGRNTQTVLTGQAVSIPLGGSNNLSAIGDVSAVGSANTDVLGLNVICYLSRWAGLTWMGTASNCSIAQQLDTPTPSPTVRPTQTATATPTPSATPRPTSTPSPTVVEPCTVSPNQSPVNLRQGPGTNYPTIGSASAADKLPVIAQAFQGGTPWYLVQLPGSTAWISSTVSILSANCGAIGFALTVPAPPPTRIPTATSTPFFPPTASFDFMFVDDYTVQFFSYASGDISSYLWNFGDGTTSNDDSPIHVYGGPGDYGVTLTVYGPGGDSSVYQTVYIAEPMDAYFVPNGLSWSKSDNAYITTNRTVSFTNQSSGGTGNYWIYGDGSPESYDLHTTHTYPNYGRYTVRLCLYSGAIACEVSYSADVLIYAPAIG